MHALPGADNAVGTRTAFGLRRICGVLALGLLNVSLEESGEA